MLHGTATILRPARDGDAARLADILRKPQVARWWPIFDAEGLREALITDGGPVLFAIEVDGDVVGSVQYAEEPAPSYRHANIDIFLDPEVHGRGLGTDAVRTLARHLFHDKGHHRLVANPAADNERAVKTFSRVGFRPVGVMRHYERDRDGEWHDCLLMDLLERDLS